MALQVANFPSDREYTWNSLVEELGLMERHIRDGSWRLCTCNAEKHLPLIAGLASEGYIFAESENERVFMGKVRDLARVLKGKLKSLNVAEADMDRVAEWARLVRHKVEARDWALSNPPSSLHVTPSKPSLVVDVPAVRLDVEPLGAVVLVVAVAAVSVVGWVLGNVLQR